SRVSVTRIERCDERRRERQIGAFEPQICIAELLRRLTLLSIEQEQTLCSDRRNDKKNNAPWRNRFVCVCQKRDHGNVEWYCRELEGDQRARKLAPGRLPENNWGDRRQQEIPSGIGRRCGGD